MLAVWFDTELGAECSFSTAADGVLRCLPGGLVSSGITSDERCDREIVFRHESEDVLGYATERDCSGTEVFEVGPLVEEPTSNDEAELCRPAGYPGGYQVVLGVVPPETFVAGTLYRQPTGSTLERRLLRADDGACSYVRGVDSQGGGEVSVRPDEEGTMRFVPPAGSASTPLSTQEMYASGDCTGRRVGLRRCEVPKLAAEVLAECGRRSTRTEFYGVGEPVDAESVYEQGEECSGPFSPSDDRYFYLGDPVPGATFPVATEQLGEGRLQRRMSTLPDGTPLQVEAGYWDDELQTLCFHVDGRCVPSFDHIVRFADDECTEPRLVYSTTGCPTPPQWAFSNSIPPQHYSVVPGEPDVTTETFYVLNNSFECNLAIDVETDEVVLHAQGPVDLETFGLVERIVE